jgi:hypothetical protein
MYWDLPQNDSEDDEKRSPISEDVFNNLKSFLIEIINFSNGTWRVFSELKDIVKTKNIKDLALAVTQGNDVAENGYL